MALSRIKSLSVAVFSVFCLSISLLSYGQEKDHSDNHVNTENHEETKKESGSKFDASEVIFGHVLDAHQYHFFSYKSSDGAEHHAVIPLPVILYSPQKGFSVFSSARFHHGEEA